MNDLDRELLNLKDYKACRTQPVVEMTDQEKESLTIINSAGRRVPVKEETK